MAARVGLHKVASFLLAFATLASAEAEFNTTITTVFKQGVTDEPYNCNFKAAIQEGQCSAKIAANLVCPDPALPHPHRWRIELEDVTVPYIRTKNSLSYALVYRDDKRPRPNACARRIIVRAAVVCKAEPVEVSLVDHSLDVSPDDVPLITRI